MITDAAFAPRARPAIADVAFGAVAAAEGLGYDVVLRTQILEDEEDDGDLELVWVLDLHEHPLA